MPLAVTLTIFIFDPTMTRYDGPILAIFVFVPDA